MLEGIECNQFAHEAAIEIDPLSDDLCTGAAPVFERNRIAENDAHFLQDGHGGIVDLQDLLLIHRLAQRQMPLQGGQHGKIGCGSQRTTGTAASPGRTAHSGFRHGVFLFNFLQEDPKIR